MSFSNSNSSSDSDWDLATKLAALDVSTHHESTYPSRGELPSPPQSPRPHLYTVDSVLNSNSPDSGTSVCHLRPASLKRSPMSVAGEQLNQVRQTPGDKAIADLASLFDRNHPPFLSQFAVWLGLDHAVDVALLLNSFAIQNAFATYRCRPGQSRISNPERLKFVVPLFTYSRETLLAWRSRYKDEVGGNMDISAALFAKQVVRFLEGSVDFEAWAPIPDHFNSMEAFEVAKWRFKVALLILWFLEKAFAMPEELGSLGDR